MRIQFRYVKSAGHHSTPTALSPLHDLPSLQILDFLGGETQLAQHLGGVLTARRGGRSQLAAVAAEGERLADQFDIAKFRVMDGLRHGEMLHLRVLEDLIDGVNGSTRYPGRVEQRDERVAGVDLRAALEGRIEGVTIAGTRGAVGKPGVVQQFWRFDGLAEALPDGLAG